MGQGSSKGWNAESGPLEVDLADASLLAPPAKRTSDLRPILPQPQTPPFLPSAMSGAHNAVLPPLFDNAGTVYPASIASLHVPQDGTIFDFPDSCQCGDACQCPACPFHSSAASSLHAHTDRCYTCLDCTLQTMPLLSNPTAPLAANVDQPSSAIWDDNLTAVSLSGTSALPSRSCTGCGGDSCSCPHCQMGCITPFDPNSTRTMNNLHTNTDCSTCLDCVLTNLPPTGGSHLTGFDASLPSAQDDWVFPLACKCGSECRCPSCPSMTIIPLHTDVEEGSNSGRCSTCIECTVHEMEGVK